MRDREVGEVKISRKGPIASLRRAVASATALRGGPAKWQAALALLVAIAWPWPVALHFGLDHYTITAALRVGGGTLLAVAAGLLW